MFKWINNPANWPTVMFSLLTFQHGYHSSDKCFSCSTILLPHKISICTVTRLFISELNNVIRKGLNLY